MRRDLVDQAGKVQGAVAFEDGAARFEGLAGEVFAFQRARRGDVPLARALVKDGWSNGVGSLYLADPVE